MDSNVLLAWGATAAKYEKGQFIFLEGDSPQFFYQIDKGEVKMVNINDDGKEFIQGFFGPGQSFGEPPLFINENYPASAVACKKTVVLRIPKSRFFNILEEDRDVERSILRILASRIHNKALTSSAIVNCHPEDRIMIFLRDYYKRQGAMFADMPVSYTRQEIANMLGLRVETVIRALTSLKMSKKVAIRNHKLYLINGNE